MNDPAPQSALREWRSHMAHPARAVALLGTAVILALMGPFQTAEVMRPLPRLGYWLVLVGISYAAGYAANRIAQQLAPDHLIQRIAIAGSLTGLAVLALVWLINGLGLDYWARGRDLAMLALNVLVIAAIISAVFQVAYATDAEPAPDPVAGAVQPPCILDRLPLDKRGPLLSLSVEDHYVRVRTGKGETLVLMRLSDAIRETGDVAGGQVHRSHWVGWNAVRTARRQGDRAILTLADGSAVPVGRANLPKIREAGLLPR